MRQYNRALDVVVRYLKAQYDEADWVTPKWVNDVMCKIGHPNHIVVNELFEKAKKGELR